ncbi:AAA family ATPase [Streptodolium elevatio]
MKLLKLTLENFRCFRGRYVMNLEVTEDHPVILVLGTNGAGKTTLLNAFTWALYGTFTKDVESPERIIHDPVWEAAPLHTEVGAFVKLEFEHDGALFVVRREAMLQKVTQQQNLQQFWPVKVTETRLGESIEIDNGQDRIEKILPEGLRKFFFFNGERMERMFTGDGTGEVKNAIKTLMGLEVMERAIETHLPAALRLLNKEARSLGDSRLQALADEEAALEQRKAAVRELELKLSADISSYQQEAEAAGKALLENQAVAPLQKRRVKLAQDLVSENDRRQEVRERKRKVLAEKGFIAFTGGIDQQVLDLADGLRQRHQLPAGIQRDFIDGLLEEGVCMCGTPVPPGSPEHTALAERRYTAGLVDVQARWMNLAGNAVRMREAREELKEELRSIAKDLQDLEARIGRIDAERSDIDRQLKGVDLADVQRLEDRRKEYEEKRFETHDQWRRAGEELSRLDEEITAVRRKFRSAKVQHDEARRVQRQVALVDEVHEALRDILELKTEEVRRQLDAKVKGIFSRICIKPFTPELTPSFEVELRADSQGKSAIRSTGENQILGLSFVGAVSDMAHEIHDRKQNKSSDSLDEGGIYPLVADSPFGSLGTTYQDEVAEALPRLTSQIVTLLSDSQASSQVMRHLQSAASRTYVLRSITSKADAKEPTIAINGRGVALVIRGDSEHTILEEVTV